MWDIETSKPSCLERRSTSVVLPAPDGEDNITIIPSLEVLNRFEKENIKKLGYVNNFLKGSKTPLKIVSNNLRDKINNYSAFEEENHTENKGYKYLYFMNLCN